MALFFVPIDILKGSQTECHVPLISLSSSSCTSSRIFRTTTMICVPPPRCFLNASFTAHTTRLTHLCHTYHTHPLYTNLPHIYSGTLRIHLYSSTHTLEPVRGLNTIDATTNDCRRDSLSTPATQRKATQRHLACRRTNAHWHWMRMFPHV